ncbi:MAG TPA: rhodanese-like domain-containing protein [Pyrinomonadaceae bacterium]
MAEIRTITTEELEGRLRGGAGLEFWNVLTDEYFSGEMIPGSRRVPLDRVGREAHELNLAKEAEVVVYCAGPKCPQSRMAAEKLQALGYTSVLAYEGGLEEWKGVGHQVESVGQTVAA